MSDGKSVAKGPLIAALTGKWATLDRLLAGLPSGRWAEPSCLPGWRVTDIVAHLIGTESMLAGESAPEADVELESLPHVRNDVAAVNEQWVRALRDESPSAMRERFRDITGRRAGSLEQMPQEDFDAPSWTPAGNATYARFMQIRTYDCWMHEQDLRVTLGIPGGEDGSAAETALEEATRALGYIVGKRAAAPDGAIVAIDLTGPLTRGSPSPWTAGPGWWTSRRDRRRPRCACHRRCSCG
ncbi:MAG TPA: maleylpyruvate isomerase family mycothiol-dependent enzyme [Actinoallomurus sp.]|jgi:uncharacterized protein (TIGR03083 family)|nr:maleylpyruvate isomerase family mycothiol-dependent enzyme [Actinoallomurus sp.]